MGGNVDVLFNMLCIGMSASESSPPGRSANSTSILGCLGGLVMCIVDGDGV
jgi:hypothetical protein